MTSPADRPRPHPPAAPPAPSGSGDADETSSGPPPAFGPPATAGEVGQLGPYRVFRVLGRGGMGAVYAALDTRLGRRLALKVMLPQFAANPTARERFLREARAAAQITHDNVVTVYEADERDGVPYIAMQFLDGYPLDEYLKAKGNPPLVQVLRIAREAAAGLAAAHKIGLVHRDVKPANLWLEAPHGRVKVLDFGLARPVDADVELTKSGTVVGTPAYMSPEQARGLKVDHRTDLFSLGAVLYRLCTGRLPFHGPNTMAVLTSLAVDEPPPVRATNPAVPESLAALIHQMLAKKPDGRPRSAEEVAERAWAIGQEVSAPRAVPVGVARPVEPSGMHVTAQEGNPFADLDGPTALRPPPCEEAAAATLRGLWLSAAGVGAAVAVLAAFLLLGKGGGTGPKPEVPPKPVAAKPEAAKVTPFELTPEPLAKVERGTPLASNALVQRPAALLGVRRWTLHTSHPQAAYNSLVYSPDGKWLAGTGTDGSIRLLDAPTAETKRIFITGQDDVAWLAWSADSTHVVALTSAAMTDKEGVSYSAFALSVWDAAAGRPVRTFPLESKTWINWADLSADQRTVALALSESGSHRIALFDLKEGKEVRRWPCDAGICAVRFSPDGKKVASVAGSQLSLWDAVTGDALPGDRMDFALAGCVWSPDGRYLAIGGHGGEVRVRDVGRGVVVTALDRSDVKFIGFDKLAWSPDSRHLLIMGDYQTSIYETKAWSKKVTLALGGINSHGAHWSPDGKSIAVATERPSAVCVPDWQQDATETISFHGGGLGHWGSRVTADSPAWGLDGFPKTGFGFDLVTGRQLPVPKEVEGWVRWAPDGNRFTVRTDVFTVRDHPGGKKLCEFDSGIAKDGAFWSEDGQFVLSSFWGGKVVKVWNPVTGKEVRQLDLSKEREYVSHARLLRDGRRLVVETKAIKGGHLVECWDLHTRKVLWSVEPGNYSQGHAVSPDESAVAVPLHGMVRVYSVKDGKELWTRPGVRGWGYAGVWTADSKHLVISDQAGLVSVRDGATGKELRNAHISGADVRSLGWIEPGKTLFASSNAGAAYAVDFATLRRVGGSLLTDAANRVVVVSDDGHFRGPEGAEDELVYVAEFDDGRQEMFTPTAFAAKFGWRNDPAKAVLDWAAKR